MPGISNLNIRHMDDARLAAEATYANFKKNFNDEVFKPDTDLQSAATFKAMTPQAKKVWEQMDPEAFKLAKEKYGG